jgi:hypothetical protein
MTKLGLALTAALVAAASAATAQPRLSNGELRPAAITGTFNRASLDALAAKTGVAWVGYAVPVTSGDHQMCCWSGDGTACCGECRLEPGSSSGVNFSRGSAGPVPLETGRLLYVLYRVEAGNVSKIRIFSDDCALDAGGMTLHWLTGVRPTDSVDLLATFVAASASRRLLDSALSALAMHHEPSALDRLIAAARDGTTAHTRGQALFWLAQRAGDKAIGAISEAITRDPETDVKRRAVFALSQLPKDQGVPLLIQVARTNSNAAVRKQAIFWLGQSKDERALRFFEEILFK